MGAKISRNGRLYLNKEKAVFVASDPGCPKVIVTKGKTALFKDDYCGKLRMGKSLVKKLL
jgi:hypothetical protein